MSNLEAAVTIAGLLLGIGIVWTLGYVKGRYDAGRSIGSRYHVTPRDPLTVRQC